ncbi:MAG: glycoside hydrolase family 99-like domain-containing protein [Rubricella sp.]
MIDRFVRLIQFLLPGSRGGRYAREIRRSGLFDRAFYLGVNPGLNPLYRLLPERHYALFGEGAGLWPNGGFCPHAYLRHSPDLAGSTLRPFQHFIRHGHAEGRITVDPPAENLPKIPFPTIRPRGPRTAPFAIQVHVYYPDLWPELEETLRGVDLAFDLFVTITHRGQETDELAERISSAFPGAHVVALPNRGRDILPFVLMVNAGLFDGYRAVCKLHTKKSPHRGDGDVWRRALIGGLLPAGGTAALLDRFLADRDAAFLVADGQHYAGVGWWGSNEAKTAALLKRLQIRIDPEALSFPAGSIYWVKPLALTLLRGLKLSPGDFEEEAGQTDGTLAHAVERAMGYLALGCGQQVREVGALPASVEAPDTPRPGFVSAFYLPQFHPVPRNDAWWGKGFTEWRSVTAAKPAFEGHWQPRYPADLGYYDLRVIETLAAQAHLAKVHGVDAFCVYHYWFDEERLLEAPLDRLLKDRSVEFPFYLAWANESWRRNWDGLSGEILMDQRYAPGFEERFVASTLPYLADPRYARPDGRRPRVVIYRPGDLPDPAASIARMRHAWAEAGHCEIELGGVLFHDGDHGIGDLDFLIEMPPHGLVSGEDYLFGGSGGDRLGTVRPGFEGAIYDYDAVIRRSLEPAYRASLPDRTIAGVMPGWDNSARRGDRAHCAFGAHPGAFRRWLCALRDERLERSYRGELFINAWNEWAEGAFLEPDAAFGHGSLLALGEITGAEAAE